MENNTHRAEAFAFLKQNILGALATLSPEGTPRVRTIYYSSDDSFNLYFLSLSNTRKVSDIHANKAAAFVVNGNDIHHTLQLEGVFEEMTDTATFGPIISELTSRLFPEGEPSAPITHMDSAKPVLFKFVPTWIRWGDFTHGTKNDESLFEINPIA